MLGYITIIPDFLKRSGAVLRNRFIESSVPTQACVLVAGVYGSYKLAGFIITNHYKSVNKRIRDAKRQANQQSIRDLAERIKQNPLDESEVERIIQMPLKDLVNELRTGYIRPITALRAYQTQALKAHSRTNCLIEAIVEAEERALQLEKGPKEGLLWGIPISIKDDVGIKGYDSAIGLVANIGEPHEDDCAMLKVMLQHGAVPFVKTNVPQTEQSYEPGNPINGVVQNPHAMGRGPGGSSSGEGALIASHGSPLGIGSDLGGSIRVPAHYCGVQGFKPTPERNSWHGTILDKAYTMNIIEPVWGGLSQDVDGLVLQMRSLWEECSINKYDVKIPWQPFDHKEYNSDRKLKIGYFTDNPVFPTFDGCKRAVQETVENLRKQGHEVVEWDAPNLRNVLPLFFRVIGNVFRSSLDVMKYDRVHPTVSLAKSNSLPMTVLKLMDKVLRLMGRGTAGKYALQFGPNDAMAYMELDYEVERFRRTFHERWMEDELDAVICPPHVMVAPPFGSSLLIAFTAMYSVLFNMLHYPAGVVRVTNVSEADVKNLDSTYTDKKDEYHMKAKRAMATSVGLPVGVMVATSHYRDETCLRVMKIVEDMTK